MDSPNDMYYASTITESFRIWAATRIKIVKIGASTHEPKAILSRGKGISRDILDPRLRSPGHGPAGVFQGHAATGRAERRSGRGRRRRVFHRHLDHGVDGPVDGSRLLQRPRLSYRAGAGRQGGFLRLHRLSDRSLRRRLHRQRADLAGRQRIRLQGGLTPAPRGHPLPHRLLLDLPRTAELHPGRARQDELVWPSTAL